jgi:hypothetical protein
MSNTRCSKLFLLILFVFGFSNIGLKVQAATSSLRDIPQTHWARDSVKTLVEDYGFMQGDPNGNFSGSRALSRYEFAKTMANMLDYLKKQMEADHKDVEGLVSVMEMFQTEIKSLETKLANANSEVAKQNATVSELNEIVVALGDEYNLLKTGSGGNSGNLATPVSDSFEHRLNQVEQKVDSLKNRGLFVDTILRGTLNDVRNVTMGAGKVLKTSGTSLKNKVSNDESDAKKEEKNSEKPPVSVSEEVNAKVSKPSVSTESEQPSKPSETLVPDSQINPSITKESNKSHSDIEKNHITKQENLHKHDSIQGSSESEDAESEDAEDEDEEDEEDLEDIDSFYD